MKNPGFEAFRSYQHSAFLYGCLSVCYEICSDSPTVWLLIGCPRKMLPCIPNWTYCWRCPGAREVRRLPATQATHASRYNWGSKIGAVGSWQDAAYIKTVRSWMTCWVSWVPWSRGVPEALSWCYYVKYRWPRHWEGFWASLGVFHFPSNWVIWDCWNISDGLG